MLHKYCPGCGSLDFRMENGLPICIRCGYKGKFNEGGMDEINDFQRSLKARGHQTQMPTEKKVPTNAELKKKLDSLKGKKTDDFEII